MSIASIELVPTSSSTISACRAAGCRPTSSPSAANVASVAAVSAASAIIVHRLLQNPYSKATTNVAGRPIRAASASRRSAAAASSPPARRLVGSQSRNPLFTSPQPIPNSATPTVSPPNGLRNSWAYRLSGSFSSRSFGSATTRRAPKRSMAARASVARPVASRKRGDSGIQRFSMINATPVGSPSSHITRHPNCGSSHDASQLVTT